jgi:[histone H3]-trimethyl-L-lysine4 demethylase
MHSTTTRGSPSRRGRPPKSRPASPTDTAASDSLQATKPSSFVISSLRIAVEGTVPINPASPDASSSAQVNGAPLPIPTSESKRAPRKSKTEALAALQSHAESSSACGDDLNPLDDDAPFFRALSPITVPDTLDLHSVKTSSPRRKQADEEPRPFGLENCPVFFPTADQFKDPTAYVRSISDVARSYGICKIVPPEGWKMPFVTNTEVKCRKFLYWFPSQLMLSSPQSFRFKTRLQRLNSIEASSRAKINFLEQLYRWHKQQGNSRVAVPTINHKPLDLWLLRKEVDRLGGYEAVNLFYFPSFTVV